MAMIKIFNADDKDFSSNGNVAIKPLKCIETKKKSLNGWYIDVEIPIEYKDYIGKDKLCVVKTKSKLMPQAFRIGEKIQYTQTKIIFQADHVFNDARDYFLVDVRPENQNGAGALNWINERTDIVSPFLVNSDVEMTSTAYLINKSLFEAWETIEERWGGVFDIDNWTIQLKQNIGLDRGETIQYGKNLQNIKIFEDWSNVVTRLYPVGSDGLMLPEQYIDGDVQYEKPYTKTVTFETDLEEALQTEENLLNELRNKANMYIDVNQFPLVSYEIISDINQRMEIGDTIHVKHHLVNLQTEVLEYQYNLNTEKVIKLIFGNFARDVKARFDSIKEEITQATVKLSSQEQIINQQTNLINMLNKTGNTYIDENEILFLDELPRENATNVLRIGMGGIGFSNNGYNGPFVTAWTLDGTFNADFIKGGTIDGALIKAGSITANQIDTQVLEQGGNNLFINPVGLFGSHGWEGECEEYTNTEIQTNTFGKSVLFLQNGSRSQDVQIPNGDYTISFLYKKQISLANCKVVINSEEFDLTAEEWTKFQHTFTVNSNLIRIVFESNADNSMYVGDLMGNSGSIAQKYSSNATEVVTNNVKIGDGIEISSNASRIKQKVDNDGNRIINTDTGEVVSEFTDKGMEIEEIEVRGKAQIAGTLIQKVGNQTWFSVV
jgi:phage minor structural protein